MGSGRKGYSLAHRKIQEKPDSQMYKGFIDVIGIRCHFHTCLPLSWLQSWGGLPLEKTDGSRRAERSLGPSLKKKNQMLTRVGLHSYVVGPKLLLNAHSPVICSSSPCSLLALALYPDLLATTEERTGLSPRCSSRVQGWCSVDHLGPSARP